MEKEQSEGSQESNLAQRAGKGGILSTFSELQFPYLSVGGQW